MIYYKPTAYGFEWGSASIDRLCSDEKNGWVYLGVQTKKQWIELYITKTGKIRVYEKRRKGRFLETPIELTKALDNNQQKD